MYGNFIGILYILLDFNGEIMGKGITACGISGLDLDLPDDGITEVGVHEVVMGCWIEEIHSFPNRQLESQPNYGKIHHAING